MKTWLMTGSALANQSYLSRFFTAAQNFSIRDAQFNNYVMMSSSGKSPKPIPTTDLHQETNLVQVKM
jgi:hypothetical protein